MTKPNKLTIKDAEYRYNIFQDKPDPTSKYYASVYRQLADTMRENERLKDGLERARTILTALGYNDTAWIKDLLQPSKVPNYCGTCNAPLPAHLPSCEYYPATTS